MTGYPAHHHPALPDQASGNRPGARQELEAGRRQGTHSLRIVLGVTVTFMLVELVGGLWTNSLALLVDAGHMLTDAAALGLSLFAV